MSPVNPQKTPREHRRAKEPHSTLKRCHPLALHMSRKTGFNRATRTAYDRLKKFGLTDKAISQQWGVSPSTLSRAKTGKQRVSQRTISGSTRQTTAQSINPFSNQVVASDVNKITYDELQDLATAGTVPRTRRLAKEALDELDKSGLTIEELQRGTFDRPTFWRTIQGKRVELLLGRTKGDAQQRRIRKQLEAKGLSFKGQSYIDFGGYGGA